ncbi:MAG: 50S ribosomal protein L20 [Candidatus Eisenbacteria bacterium]|nr:50S ribosomal protein L20 [Candidatus Eisenbacteria bacterium]
MPRAKSGPPGHRRHRKVLGRAKGFRGGRGKQFRAASYTVQKALRNAYVGRKRKKGDFRSLWIVRIGAATRVHGLSYSRFIDGLNKAGVELNRKALAHLAVHDEQAFGALVETARGALGGKETTAAGATTQAE